jgi:hypothetical protein
MQTTNPGTPAGIVKSYTYAYLVALTWLGDPPLYEKRGQHSRVGHQDGDRDNHHPGNLFWVEPRSHVRRAEYLQQQRAYRRTLAKMTSTEGEFVSIAEAPDHFIKEDGTLWKLKHNGDLIQKRGHLTGGNRPAAMVSLKPHIPHPVPLADIVLSLYGIPRPGAQYRATTRDGNPANTRPDNLYWIFLAGARPSPHIFTPGSKRMGSAFKGENERKACLEAIQILTDQGARQLKNNPTIWAHPHGRIIVIDRETGQMETLRPTKDGKFYLPGGFMEPDGSKRTYSTRGHNPCNFIADAFPDLLGRYRGPAQNCYPLDYNWQHLHPGNVGYGPTSRYAPRVWHFVGPKRREPLYMPGRDETTTHPTAAHSEPPADPTTDQDSSPDADAFEFDL